jgi:hypothetical protein
MTAKELAFKIFDDMPAGQVIAIKEIAKKDPETFKQYIKDYIDTVGNITVSGDWKKFRKDNDSSGFMTNEDLAWILEFKK